MSKTKTKLPFHEQVWNVCKMIPRGKVTTYKIIANYLNTNGYRAVGLALNKNPYWPDVPCHRVVGSNGHLTGFASGLEEKKAHLIKEGVEIKNNKIDLKKYLYDFTEKD